MAIAEMRCFYLIYKLVFTFSIMKILIWPYYSCQYASTTYAKSKCISYKSVSHRYANSKCFFNKYILYYFCFFDFKNRNIRVAVSLEINIQ